MKTGPALAVGLPYLLLRSPLSDIMNTTRANDILQVLQKFQNSIVRIEYLLTVKQDKYKLKITLALLQSLYLYGNMHVNSFFMNASIYYQPNHRHYADHKKPKTNLLCLKFIYIQYNYNITISN